MTDAPNTSPSFKANGFNCPFCRAYADQGWGQPQVVVKYAGRSDQNYDKDENFWICRCAACQQCSIWMKKQLVYPSQSTAPTANPDLPEDIKADYEEARNIVSLSPRGAAALLRLAIQKLCKHLGEAGENINADTKSLVEKGLSPMVQQALDTVRVVGNNAVHPGQIDLNDDPDIAAHLFGLVNVITEVMVSQPKHVSNIYTSVVPQSQRDAIAKRDQ